MTRTPPGWGGITERNRSQPLADRSRTGLLRQPVRDALRSLYPGWPDEQWPDSWRDGWNTLSEIVRNLISTQLLGLPRSW